MAKKNPTVDELIAEEIGLNSPSYFGGKAVQYRKEAAKLNSMMAAQEACKALLDSIERSAKKGQLNEHDLEAAIAFAERALGVKHGATKFGAQL